MPAILLDHIVLTVTDIERSAQFYHDTLGLDVCTTATGRVSLHLGTQKINLHQYGAEFDPKAAHPTPGSADLCFLMDETQDAFLLRMKQYQIKIIEGPVLRHGANGAMTSYYFRDPDNNLLEASFLNK